LFLGGSASSSHAARRGIASNTLEVTHPPCFHQRKLDPLAGLDVNDSKTLKSSSDCEFLKVSYVKALLPLRLIMPSFNAKTTEGVT